MTHFSKVYSSLYSTFSPSILELGEVAKKRLNRVAFVGTPCQINTLRRMEVMGIVPSGTIKYPFRPVLHRQLPFRPGAAAEAGRNRRFFLGRRAPRSTSKKT